MLGFFPLFALILIAYNVVAFGGGFIFDSQAIGEALVKPITSISMMSGDTWQITLGDIFIVASLLILFIEIVKSTRTEQSSIINHAMSMLVFIVFLIEFIVLEGFGNTTFFLMMAMSLLDVVAGFTVTISTARRDLGIGEGIFAGS